MSASAGMTTLSVSRLRPRKERPEACRALREAADDEHEILGSVAELVTVTGGHEAAVAAARGDVAGADAHEVGDHGAERLERAARGLKVGVLSNTIWSREYHRGIFERDGVLDLIDADVYSSEIRVTKPHALAFETACRALDVAPTSAVYVGDRLFEDVLGSQEVGMRAIWVPHSEIPLDQQIAVEVEPDATVQDLGVAELMRVMTEPKNALVTQYQKLFLMDNVELTFEGAALQRIAKVAMERKTGARGLRAILVSTPFSSGFVLFDFF